MIKSTASTGQEPFSRLFPLLGQHRVSRILQKAIVNEKIGSAYLFAGPRGSGKMSAALNFAAALNCESPDDYGFACGECSACQKIAKIDHSNIVFIYALPRPNSLDDTDDPIDKMKEPQFQAVQAGLEEFRKDVDNGIHISGANNILTNSIRVMKRNLSMASSENGHRVVIIYLSELMNRDAFSALLKVLEEPPVKTTFIITTESFAEVPATIKSRCQILHFTAISEKEMLRWLEDQSVPEERRPLIARLSEGSIRRAKALLQEDILAGKESYLDFWRNIMGGNFGALTSVMDTWQAEASADKESLFHQLQMMIFWLRDAQILEADPNFNGIIHAHLREPLQKFARFFPGFPYFAAISKVEEAMQKIRGNGYIPAVLGELFTDLTYEMRGIRERVS